MQPSRHSARIVIVLALVAVVTVIVAPMLGPQFIGPSAWWGAGDPGDANIFWKMRAPRVCLGFLAGGGLALAGMAFQAMFRNPLAEPFTLGVSSGASLGAALCILLGFDTARWGFRPISLWAFGGTLAAVLLVYGLTRARRGFSTATMLLAGVAVSFFFSSVILFLQYLSDFTRTFRMLRWVMGGMDRVVGFGDFLDALPFVAGGALVLFYLCHELNLIASGEELAASRGVEVDRTKLLLFLTTSLMVGAIVAACGPIGFIGLMAPHICRLLVGADHRWLTPASLLFGGAFLVICDTAARTIIAPTELPVGIITALLGGPFFLWLLLRRAPESC